MTPVTPSNAVPIAVTDLQFQTVPDITRWFVRDRSAGELD
jgi:hypothetical protein